MGYANCDIKEENRLMLPHDRSNCAIAFYKANDLGF